MIVLFDGVCNFCNGYVDFVIRRDPARKVRFAALQSAAGQRILGEFGLSGEPLSTLIVVEDDRYFTASTAVLRIVRGLSGLWPALYIFILIPPFIRNALYGWFARNRYRWFGKRDVCRLPGPGEQERFIS